MGRVLVGLHVAGLGAVAERELEHLDAVVLLGDGGVKRAVLVVRLTGAVQHLGLAVGADALNDQNMAERFAGPFPFAGVEATPAGVGRRGGVGLHGADAPRE